MIYETDSVERVPFHLFENITMLNPTFVRYKGEFEACNNETIEEEERRRKISTSKSIWMRLVWSSHVSHPIIS